MNSTNVTDLDTHIMDMYLKTQDLWIVLAVSLIGIVILVGCTGNIMVILAIKKIKKLHTVSNIFVMNLSICDLLFVGCVLPFNIYTYIIDGWNITPPLCKFVGFIGYTLTGTTIITITLIAYNRYKLVLDPGAYKLLYTRRNIAIMLLIAWLVPVSCLTPALAGIWGQFGYVPMMVTCNLVLEHKSQLFKIILMLLRAGIPCGLIVYFYARIYLATRTSHRRLYRNSRTFSALDLHNHRKEMHMTRMMLIIFIVFIISYFPCTITGLIDWEVILSKTFHMFCQISIYLGSAINPLVYGLMNSQFRHAYVEFICCVKQETIKWSSSSAKEVKTSCLDIKAKSSINQSAAGLSETCTQTKKYHPIKTLGLLTLDREDSKDQSSESSCQSLLHVPTNNENRPRFTLA